MVIGPTLPSLARTAHGRAHVYMLMHNRGMSRAAAEVATMEYLSQLDYVAAETVRLRAERAAEPDPDPIPY